MLTKLERQLHEIQTTDLVDGGGSRSRTRARVEVELEKLKLILAGIFIGVSRTLGTLTLATQGKSPELVRLLSEGLEQHPVVPSTPADDIKASDWLDMIVTMMNSDADVCRDNIPHYWQSALEIHHSTDIEPLKEYLVAIMGTRTTQLWPLLGLVPKDEAPSAQAAPAPQTKVIAAAAAIDNRTPPPKAKSTQSRRRNKSKQKRVLWYDKILDEPVANVKAEPIQKLTRILEKLLTQS